MTGIEREHAVDIAGYEGDLTALAVEIGRLRYDASAHFLRALSAELARQAEGDRERGRPQLAARLDDLSRDLSASADKMRAIWALCRPHVPYEVEKSPEIDP